MNGLFAIGAVFSVLAALCAYFIAYHEYRQRMLRPDQDPKRLALGTAFGTLTFFMVASWFLAQAL